MEARKVRRPDFRIRTLIGEMERNRFEMQEERTKFQQLQEKMNKIIQDEHNTPSTAFMSMTSLPKPTNESGMHRGSIGDL